MIIIPSNIGAPKIPVTFKGATGAVVSGSALALPSHSAGDIIVIAAFTESDTQVSKPSAGGTVPAWVDINVSNRIRTAYFVATSSNTTSGIWSGARQLVAAVLSGQGASPIGGSANNSGDTTPSVTAPSVTMQATDQSSQLLHFGFHEQGNRNNTAFSTSGYTVRVDPSSADAYRLVTKNDTSSDGSLIVITASGNTTFGAATIEIVA